MAKRPTLTDITSGFASSVALNANNSNIETAFDNTISRDGSSPNFMQADLDLNSNKLLNVATPTSLQDGVNKLYVDSLINTVSTAVDGVDGIGVTPEQFGAVGDGVTDDTTALQSWINSIESLGTLGFGTPDSTYLVSSSLTIDSSKVYLRGNGATINFSGTDGDVISVVGTSAARLKDIEICDWIVDFDEGRSAFIYARGVTNLKVCYNTINNGRLFWSWLTSDSSGLTGASWDAAKPDISSLVEADLLKDLWIVGNKVTGSGIAVSASSGREINGTCYASWVWGATIFGNQFQDDKTGIRWWGGDSNFARDGGAGSVRWARRYTIVGNVVSNFGSGGIWGSQGMDITCTGNVAEKCLDIGIHGEGSDGITVTGNTMRNCKFGGFNSYFVEERAVYSSNTVVITDSATYGTTMAKNNLGSDIEGFEVLMANNVFEMDDTATGVVELQRGGTIKFIGNILRRVVIESENTNAGTRVFEANHLLFDRDPGTYAISHGPGRHAGSDRDARVFIENNVIEAWGWVATGFQPAIYVLHTGASGSDRSTASIRYNRIFGYNDGTNQVACFPQDIVTESANTTGSHITDIVENGIYAGIILDISDKSGVAVASLNQLIFHNGNYSSLPDYSFPYRTVPTNGVYLFGSRISIDRPGVGTATDYVVAGTQKVWAPTSGTYNNSTDYVVGDQIDDGTRVYVAIAANGPASTVVAPGSDNTVWRDIAPVGAASSFVGYGHTSIVGSDTWNPASIADGDNETHSFSVSGVALGDHVISVSFSLNTGGLTLTADVTATDQVTANLANNTGAAVDLGSGTVSVLVRKA